MKGASLFSSGAAISNAIESGGTLFFQASLGLLASTWSTRGTEATTQKVGDGFSPLVAGPGGIVFLSQSSPSESGYELWKSDGTAAGTRIVKDIWPGSQGGLGLAYPRRVGDTVFFVADDGVHGEELWRSDGTVEGTMLVKDISPGAVSALPFAMVATRSRVFFLASDFEHGIELWKSDGTSAGTVLVKDIAPGPDGSNFYNSSMLAVGEWIVFSATDGVSGVELYTSDGTAAGTFQVQDIVPGPIGSNPASFRVSGDQLYFSAGDPVHGSQLWTIRASALFHPWPGVGTRR